MHNYAHFLYIAERYEESLTLFDETVSLAHEAFGDLIWLTQSIRLRYARNLAKRKRYEEAEIHNLNVFQVRSEQLGPDSRQTRDVIRRLIRLYERWDRPEKVSEFRALLPEQKSES